MQSPFLGMDPYIESCGLWEDFHDLLIGEIHRQLSEILPEAYVVRAGERSYIALESTDPEHGVEKHTSQPDVAVLAIRQQTAEWTPRGAASGAAVLDEPVDMTAAIEAEYRESFLEISAVHPERKLVTTIELLSPSNKRYGSAGWDLYLRKRQAHFIGRANLVEIDLLRAGQRMPMETEWPDSPYALLVYRRHLGSRCKVWPAYSIRPLPVIPIPLSPPDADISLNVQPLVNQIYGRSRYARDIDYRKPCRPPLSDSELRWLEQRLAPSAVNG